MSTLSRTTKTQLPGFVVEQYFLQSDSPFTCWRRAFNLDRVLVSSPEMETLGSGCSWWVLLVSTLILPFSLATNSSLPKVRFFSIKTHFHLIYSNLSRPISIRSSRQLGIATGWETASNPLLLKTHDLSLFSVWLFRPSVDPVYQPSRH